MPLACFVLPTLIPVLFWGESLKNAWLVATMFRWTFVLNVTWLVNSAAHLYGNHPYDKWVSLLTHLKCFLFAVFPNQSLNRIFFCFFPTDTSIQVKTKRLPFLHLVKVGTTIITHSHGTTKLPSLAITVQIWRQCSLILWLKLDWPMIWKRCRLTPFKSELNERVTVRMPHGAGATKIKAPPNAKKRWLHIKRSIKYRSCNWF